MADDQGGHREDAVAVLACNHCTGVLKVEKMLEREMPVVPATGSHGSKSDLYLGNGDRVLI